MIGWWFGGVRGVKVLCCFALLGVVVSLGKPSQVKPNQAKPSNTGPSHNQGEQGETLHLEHRVSGVSGVSGVKVLCCFSLLCVVVSLGKTKPSQAEPSQAEQNRTKPQPRRAGTKSQPGAP